MELTKEELIRYNRQIIIPEFGKEAQKILKKAKVGIAGVGGLGSIICIYLTAAGIGELLIVDKGKVELTDLNRQILFYEKDVGKYKVTVARERLQKLNKWVKVTICKEELTERNINKIFEGVDCVIDALDNIHSRLILNKFIIDKNIPLFHGAIHSMSGWITTIIPKKTACLNCIYEKLPQEKEQETIPVIGAIPALIGAFQTIEVIKYLTKTGNLLLNKLLIYDAKDIKFEEVLLKRNINCEVCQKG